jgi:hypothetical protein
MGERASRIVAAALWTGSLVVAAYHAALVSATVRLGEPMGLWEVTYAFIAREFPSGYQWGHFVLGHDNYGPLFPLFCQPFIYALGNPYLAGRVANALALLGATVSIVVVARRSGASWTASAASGAIVLGFAAGSYSIQVRPDFLALVEVVLSLGVGQALASGRVRGGPAGILLGLAGLAGYLTKPYIAFAPAAAVVAASLRVRGPALAAGVIGACICAGGVLLYAGSNPYYLLETFSAHIGHTDPSGPWLVHQAVDFTGLAFGLVAAAAIGGLCREIRADPSYRYWGVISLLATAVLLVGLGWHTGAYLTYFMHLLLVPLAVCGAVALTRLGRSSGGVAASLALLANTLVLVLLAPRLPGPDAGWEALRADVLGQAGPVVVDAIMEPLSRERAGVCVVDTGMVRYAGDEVRAGASREAKRAEAECAAYEAHWSETLARRPAAIYLDFIVHRDPAGHPGLVARNGLAWLSPIALGYKPAAAFHIHPYYLATNERRQGAGTWECVILKFVPTGG